MPRWLFKCEVETHVCLADGVEELEFSHPLGSYRVILRNNDVAPGVETPLLDAFVIFEAADFEAAAVEGPVHLREFLATLVFATGSRLRHHRDVLLCDWTPETRTHEFRQFNAGHPTNFPGRVLIPTLMESTSALLERDRPEFVKRALRYFSNGVCGGPPDEQFEWFWLAVEVMAQFTRNVQPIPDACPRCRGPLYCNECKETPTHRPYAKQAILALIRQHAGDAADALFEDASAFRDAMTHGESIKGVEEARRRSLHEVVDELGLVAWKSVGVFLIPVEADSAARTVSVLSRGTYLNKRLRVAAHGSFESPPDREPTLDDIPKLNLSIIRGDAQPPTPTEGETLTT